MNNRAIQLYKDAMAFAYARIGKEYADATYFQGVVAGKFAELLLKEACEVIKREDDMFDGVCQKTIKNHFGITE